MKSNLKVVQTEPEAKKLHEKTMLEIIGREQKKDLKPPFFPDAEKQEPELTPFKKRLLELWKRD